MEKKKASGKQVAIGLIIMMMFSSRLYRNLCRRPVRRWGRHSGMTLVLPCPLTQVQVLTWPIRSNSQLMTASRIS